jgi:hypothetical protein
VAFGSCDAIQSFFLEVETLTEVHFCIHSIWLVVEVVNVALLIKLSSMAQSFTKP